MLIETVSFTTTPDDILDSLTRIIADRAVGAAFFGDYHLMDYELMGGDARQAHNRRGRQAQHCGKPAAASAFRFAPMADADHAGTWRQEPGRPSMSVSLKMPAQRRDA
jgi:hypothetical protein